MNMQKNNLIRLYKSSEKLIIINFWGYIYLCLRQQPNIGLMFDIQHSNVEYRMFNNECLISNINPILVAVYFSISKFVLLRNKTSSPYRGVAPITQLRTRVIKIVTFKGGHLM